MATIPTFVSVGTDAGGVGSVTPGLPASVAADDILILHIEGEGEDANADDPPTGGEWTFMGSNASAETGQNDRTRHSIYWHRYDGSTDPNRVVPDAGNHTLAVITAWRGILALGDPIHQLVGSTNSTNSTTLSATGVTTTIDDCLIVISASSGDDVTTSGWTNANLADPSVTEAADVSTTAGSDGAIHVAYGGLATAGASGTTTATKSASEEQANWVLALHPAIPAISDVDTDEEIDDKQTGVVWTGATFETVQGTGKVEISDDATYGSGNVVAQTVTAWTTGTTITTTVVLGAMAPGTPRYGWVTNDSGDRNTTGFVVHVHRAQAFRMVASANIAASGENTTRQLEIPSGKVGGDFDGGRVQDDENPGDTVDLTLDGFREDEYCMEAVADSNEGKPYEFRLLIGGAVPATISVTPEWTVGTPVDIGPIAADWARRRINPLLVR